MTTQIYREKNDTKHRWWLYSKLNSRSVTFERMDYYVSIDAPSGNKAQRRLERFMHISYQKIKFVIEYQKC
jgi:hypothetical protein